MQGICNKTLGEKTITYYKGDGVLWGSVLILFLNGVSYFPPANKQTKKIVIVLIIFG